MANKMKVQITKNSQYIVTIPKALAESFNFRKGTVLGFRINDRGELTLKRK